MGPYSCDQPRGVVHALPEHLRPTDLGAGEHVTYEGTLVSDFARGVTIPACGAGDFHLYHVAPRLANGWAYLGELSKFVPARRHGR